MSAGKSPSFSSPLESDGGAPTVSVRAARLEDATAWDCFVRKQPHASPYHLFGWHRAVEQAYGQPARYLLAENDGRICGVLPIILIRRPLFGDCAVSLPFCDFAGPLAEDSITTSGLLREAAAWSASKGADLEIRCNRSVPELQQEGLAPVTAIGSKVRMVLSLPESSEELFAAFKTKMRNDIRRPERNGLQFHWGSPEKLSDFYRVYCNRMHDLGSPAHSHELFDYLLCAYGDAARLGIVRLEDTTVAAGIYLSAGKLTCVPWSVSLREFNKLAPNMMLYWNFLKEAADSGIRFFDFGRSTIDAGTYRFKKQWGAIDTPLAWYTSAKQSEDDSRNGLGGKRMLLEGLWRKLPLPLANLLGPRLRKYVSL